MANFFEDLLRIVTNPYGNVTQRDTNAAIKNTFQDQIGRTVQRIAPQDQQAPRTVSSRDEAIDQLVQQFDLGHITDVMRQLGFNAPQDMPMEDATTRAFISIAEEQGATLEEIARLLEQDLSPDLRAVPGTGMAQFGFADIPDTLRELTDRLSPQMTLGNLAAMFPRVVEDQSPERRQQRAAEESARETLPPQREQFSNATLDRIFNRLADILGNHQQQTIGQAIERTFRYIATNSAGVDVTGELKGRKAGEIRDQLERAGLFPTSIRESQPRQSALERAMNSFADFMDVPRFNPNMNADELTEAIDGLTEATQGSRTVIGTLAQRLQPLATSAARVGTRLFRRVNRGIQRMIPAPYRARIQQLGARLGTRVATRFGVNPAVAARFGAAVGPAGIAIAALSAGASVISAGASMAYKALSSLAKQSLETTYRLAKYSGVLASANAQLEANRILRDIQSADDIKKSGRDRLEAQDRLERALRPWGDMLTNIGNRIGTVGSNATSTFLESDTAVFGALSAAFGLIPGLVMALNKNTDAVEKEVKENRDKFGGNLDNAPIMQWHKQMFNDPFDPVRNAPRKPIGPLP